jgi:hypothetical protein
MLKYILEMLQGDDGKVSSGKVMKILAFIVAISFFIVDVFNNDIDIIGYIGMLLGFSLGTDVSQKVTNALQNNQGK